jgi:hypothetical protein
LDPGGGGKLPAGLPWPPPPAFSADLRGVTGVVSPSSSDGAGTTTRFRALLTGAWPSPGRGVVGGAALAPPGDSVAVGVFAPEGVTTLAVGVVGTVPPLPLAAPAAGAARMGFGFPLPPLTAVAVSSGSLSLPVSLPV